MKNNLLILSLALFIHHLLLAQSWEVVGEAGFPNEEVGQLNMTLDGNGVPYVAYLKLYEGANFKISVMKYENGTWQYVGEDGFSENVSVLDLAFAIDSNNTPYVAYRNDLYSSSQMSVMAFENGSWQFVGEPEFSVGGVGYISMAIDGNDIPYVLFVDGTNDNKATAMSFVDGSWQTVGQAGFSAGEVSYTELAFDANNIPYAAFSDGANNNGATVMKFEDNSWQSVGSPGISVGGTGRLSLNFNSFNIPFVAYTNLSSPPGNPSGISVMQFEDNTWQYVGPMGISPSSSYSPSLVFDTNDTAYVAHGNSSAFQLSVVAFENDIWQAVGDIDYYGWESVSLDIHDDLLYLGIKEIVSPYGATVLQYDNTMGVGDNSMLGGVLLYPNPTHGSVTISNIPTNSSIQLFDSLGKQVFTTHASQQITIDTAGFSTGIYVVKVVDAQRRQMVKKLVVS